jgi:hypothetical protein
MSILETLHFKHNIGHISSADDSIQGYKLFESKGSILNVFQWLPVVSTCLAFLPP